MDVKLIMEFYGIACAIFLPLCLILTIVFARKGGIIEKLNKWLDDNVIKKTAQPKEEKSQTEKAKPNEVKSKWETNNEIMTCLRMKTGDTYLCALTDIEKNEVGSQREWKVSEPSVGKIDENTSVFTALKAGETYIECGDVRIYYIEVAPKNKNWFAANIYNAFVKGMTREEMNNSCPNDFRKIRDIHSTKLQIELTDIAPAKSAIIQFDKKGLCHRVLYRIPSNTSIFNTIQEGMKERMDEIPINPVNMKIWVHTRGRKGEEVVDNAAFMLSAKNKTTLFGFGPNWRQEGTIEEFKANLGMFIHTFSALVEEDELPEIQAAFTNDDSQSIKNNETKEENASELEPKGKTDESITNDSSKQIDNGKHNDISEEWDEIDDEILDDSIIEEEQEFDYQ